MADGIYNDFVPYTYIIGWTSLNKWYYGSSYGTEKKAHPSQLWSTYFTSSRYVKAFREEYGEPDFIQVTNTFASSEETKEFERYVLKFIDAKRNPKFLNRSNGDGHYGGVGKVSEETRNRISVSMKGKLKGIPLTEETKKKISESSKGRVHTEETKQKLRTHNLGKKHTSEAIQKIAEAGKRLCKEETKKKISESTRGRKRSAITRQKISLSAKGRTPPNKGKSPSLEVRQKMSESAKKRRGRLMSEETKMKISEKAKLRHMKKC